MQHGLPHMLYLASSSAHRCSSKSLRYAYEVVFGGYAGIIDLNHEDEKKRAHNPLSTYLALQKRLARLGEVPRKRNFSAAPFIGSGPFLP